MYNNDQKLETSDAEKARAKGQSLLIIIALIKILGSGISFVLDGGLLSLIISIALAIALAGGVNWVRWLCVVGGIIANLYAWVVLAQLVGIGGPAYLIVLMIVVSAIDIVMILILAKNKKINAFIEHKKLYPQEYGSSSWPQGAARESVKEIEKKPCIFCGEEVTITNRFCTQCGGNLAEKAAEDFRIRRENLLQGGYGVLLADEKTINDVKMMRRVYGSGCCISYLKGKAKELGVYDIVITADELDCLLGV